MIIWLNKNRVETKLLTRKKLLFDIFDFFMLNKRFLGSHTLKHTPLYNIFKSYIMNIMLC